MIVGPVFYFISRNIFDRVWDWRIQEKEKATNRNSASIRLQTSLRFIEPRSGLAGSQFLSVAAWLCLKSHDDGGAEQFAAVLAVPT